MTTTLDRPGTVLDGRASGDGEASAHRRTRVLLTTEGTYPHVLGGVSTWCDQLVKAMPEIDFTIFALMMNPFIPPSYELPDNSDLIKVPIWGVEEPAEFNPSMSPRRVIELSAAMTEEVAQEEFVPHFRPLIEHITSDEFDPEYFGNLLYQIHIFFREHDYRATFRTRAVWDTFREVMLESCGVEFADTDRWEDVEPEAQPSVNEIVARFGQMRRIPIAAGLEASREGVRVPRLHDATESLRVLYRLLTPINYQIPETDVVHATAAAFCGIPGIIAKLERGTPFLVTEHGVFMREQMLFLGRIGFPYHLRRFFIQLISAVSRTVYHYADQISPVCAYNARWEAANGAKREQIHVIYNGVDPDKFSPREVERPANPTVVMIARLDPLKDVETALRTADLTRREIPDVKFLYYGPAPDEEYRERCEALHKELGLGDTWQWKGSTKDPAGAFNQGDVVLLSSISEAFPYTVIEAMMCAKPVVATNVGGVAEAVADLGATARVRDAAGLSQGIVQLLRLPDDERARLGEACRRRALDLFTIDEAIQEYLDTYELLASGERRTRVRLVPTTLPAPVVESDPVRAPTVVAPTREAGPALPAAEPPQPPRPEPAPLPAAGPAPEPHRVAAPAAIAFAAVDLSSADAVRRAFRHPTPDIRRRAIVAATEQLPLPETLRLLSQLLPADPDPEVRMAAASTLGELLGTRDGEAS